MTPPRRPPPGKPATPVRRAPASGPVESLDHPLESARIIGLSHVVAVKLARKGIRTIRDLIEQPPRRYLDLSHTKTIPEIEIGEEATIVGEIRHIDSRYVRSGRHMLTLRVEDASGRTVEAVWWNQPFRARMFAVGAAVAVAGRFERRNGRLQVAGKVLVERLPSDGEGESVHTGRIIPVHESTEGVTPTMMRRFVFTALKRYGPLVTDPVPEDLAEREELMPRLQAFQQMHFPASVKARGDARRRLAFEELFVLSAGLAVRKRRIERETPGIAQPQGREQVDRFLASLPFPATGAQRRAIEEILVDLASPVPMHRLLQGEVGSGKTVVAVAAAVAAAANGNQVALMAPTEVLAEQHYLSVTSLLSGAAAPERDAPGQMSLEAPGFRVELLTGSAGAAHRERALSAARTGEAHLLVGTHALIQEGVAFNRLGVAIIDEQHRFGVHQRIALRGKGEAGVQPDVLIMTATPIPRTLAMTLYGDLDTSTLDEMPPGRRPVTTRVLDASRRPEADELIRAEVAAGRQAFIVCPLVEESAKLEAKAAESEFERVGAEVFPDLRVGLIHGRLRPAEKEAVMTRMRAGEIDVLVATTVIEVGVDIPNASVMVVEDADRFGLSQLHQLRGRIGRGRHASTCLLISSLDPGGEDDRDTARKRLQAMASTADGFRLAELDLEIRGEGQIFGRARPDADAPGGAPAQAGATDLRFASLLRDHELLTRARREAFRVVDADPQLKEHPLLLAEVRHRFADRLDWLFAG